MSYTPRQLELQREVAHAVATDPRAVRRGVSCIILHPHDWMIMGCPLGLCPLVEWVPVDPLGTREGHYRWLYRKGPRRGAAFRRGE